MSLQDLPEELHPHISDLLDRYHIYHIQKDDEDYTVHYIAPIGNTGVEYHRYVNYPNKYNNSSWYNPNVSYLEHDNIGESFHSVFPRLKSHLSPKIQDEMARRNHSSDNLIYRGISHEEYNNIMKTGIIKSKGDYNLEGQEGLTYFSTDPTVAAHYATGFAPVQYKPTLQKPSYVISIPKNKYKSVHIPGVGEHEVGISEPVSVGDIHNIYVAKPYSAMSGSRQFRRQYFERSKYEFGSASPATTHVYWESIKE